MVVVVVATRKCVEGGGYLSTGLAFFDRSIDRPSSRSLFYSTNQGRGKILTNRSCCAVQGGNKACYDHDDDDDQEEVYVNKSDEVDKWIIEDDRQVQRDSVVVVFGSGRQRRKFRVFGR